MARPRVEIDWKMLNAILQYNAGKEDFTGKEAILESTGETYNSMVA